MALLGEAFVRVRPDTDGFEKEASGKIGGGLKRIAGAVTAAFGAIKVGGFLKDAIGEASDYGETVSKSANVFGQKLAPAIQKFAATAPKAFGISETAALSATAQFGNMFIQLGFTGDAAAKASTNLIKTAADLGSFNNVDPSDVLERIGASLRGEFDSLQQLIPNINAARVEHEALAATGKKTAKELTAQEKATATLAIIQKDGALAANDFAETSGGLANQQRILTATVDTLKRRIGEALLPVVTKVVTYLTDNAEPAFNRVSTAVRGFLQSLSGKGEQTEFTRGLLKVKDALVNAFREVRNSNAELPKFSGLLDVGAGALRLVANNADFVVKALPFLVAGFIAVKTAQATANLVALASLPLRTAELAASFALARANSALAFQMALTTGIERQGIVTRIAGTVATAASAVASGIATVATAAFAAATTALGIAIRFATGPVGLIILAIAGLAAGLVLAYKKSETFRDIVNAALGAVKTAFTALASGALGVIDKILAGYQAMASAAGKLPGPLGAPFRAAAEAIGVARQGVQALTDKINAVPKSKTSDVKANVRGTSDVQSLRRSIDSVNSKTVFLTTVLKTENQRDANAAARGTVQGRRAAGGPVQRNFAYLVGEREPEVFVPGQSGRVYNQKQIAALVGQDERRGGNVYNITSTVPLDERTTVEMIERAGLLYG